MSIDIVAGQRVALLAIQLRCLARRNGVAAKKIYAPRNGLKMIGVNTVPDAAKVIGFLAGWNRPVEPAEGKDMGADDAFAVPELSVAMDFIDVAYPQPTAAIWIDFDFCKEKIGAIYHDNVVLYPQGRIGYRGLRCVAIAIRGDFL